MHQESLRAFPVVAFQDDGMPIMDCRIHAATELLSCGALKNRNVFHQGKGKGVTVVYQWTELGLRMLLSIHAINPERKKELSDQISAVPEASIPPQKLMDFPKPEVVPAEGMTDPSRELQKVNSTGNANGGESEMKS